MEKKRFYRVDYRGRSYEFKFLYTYTFAQGYRAYISEAPSYSGRSTGGGVTHRNKDGDRFFICWSKRIRTEKQMNAVVDLWCRATVMYIVNGGQSIDEHAKRIMQAL